MVLVYDINYLLYYWLNFLSDALSASRCEILSRNREQLLNMHRLLLPIGHGIQLKRHLILSMNVLQRLPIVSIKQPPEVSLHKWLRRLERLLRHLKPLEGSLGLVYGGLDECRNPEVKRLLALLFYC